VILIRQIVTKFTIVGIPSVQETVGKQNAISRTAVVKMTTVNKKPTSGVHLRKDTTGPTKYRNKITNERFEGADGDGGVAYIDGVKFRRVFPVNVGQRPVLVRDDALEKC
jgi:hypothetical protein